MSSSSSSSSSSTIQWERRASSGLSIGGGGGKGIGAPAMSLRCATVRTKREKNQSLDPDMTYAAEPSGAIHFLLALLSLLCFGSSCVHGVTKSSARR